MSGRHARKRSQCQLILDELLDGEAHPMHDLSRASGSLNVHSRIADLRKRGHVIEQWSERDERTSTSVSFYRLTSLASPALPRAMTPEGAGVASEGGVDEVVVTGSAVTFGEPVRRSGSGEDSGLVAASVLPTGGGSSTEERDVANVEAAGSIPAPRSTSHAEGAAVETAAAAAPADSVATPDLFADLAIASSGDDEPEQLKLEAA